MPPKNAKRPKPDATDQTAGSPNHTALPHRDIDLYTTVLVLTELADAIRDNDLATITTIDQHIAFQTNAYTQYPQSEIGQAIHRLISSIKLRLDE